MKRLIESDIYKSMIGIIFEKIIMYKSLKR